MSEEQVQLGLTRGELTAIYEEWTTRREQSEMVAGGFSWFDVDESIWQKLRSALHPTDGLYACPTCGENVTRYGQRCERCTRNLEEDRLERESGR